uniref:Uncharacterized protein n=1 Tax=Arundo donax TaxID=35708 RepID=A0A0A9GTU2_ARUDO
MSCGILLFLGVCRSILF